MDLIPRRLRMDLPKRQSAFLWGPRKTGKSTLLRQGYPDSLVYDFLDTELALEFSKRPALAILSGAALGRAGDRVTVKACPKTKGIRTHDS